MLDDLRRKPKKDCLDGFRIDGDAFTRNDIPKVNDFRKPEFTLGELGIERIVTKLEEKEVEMFFMFFVGIGKDRDVVEIDHHELSRYSMKCSIRREEVAGALERSKEKTVYRRYQNEYEGYFGYILFADLIW